MPLKCSSSPSAIVSASPFNWSNIRYVPGVLRSSTTRASPCNRGVDTALSHGEPSVRAQAVIQLRAHERATLLTTGPAGLMPISFRFFSGRGVVLCTRKISKSVVLSHAILFRGDRGLTCATLSMWQHLSLSLLAMVYTCTASVQLVACRPTPKRCVLQYRAIAVPIAVPRFVVCRGECAGRWHVRWAVRMAIHRYYVDISAPRTSSLGAGQHHQSE